MDTENPTVLYAAKVSNAEKKHNKLLKYQVGKNMETPKVEVI